MGQPARRRSAASPVGRSGRQPGRRVPPGRAQRRRAPQHLCGHGSAGRRSRDGGLGGPPDRARVHRDRRRLLLRAGRPPLHSEGPDPAVLADQPQNRLQAGLLLPGRLDARQDPRKALHLGRDGLRAPPPADELRARWRNAAAPDNARHRRRLHLGGPAEHRRGGAPGRWRRTTPFSGVRISRACG